MFFVSSLLVFLLQGSISSLQNPALSLLASSLAMVGFSISFVLAVTNITCVVLLRKHLSFSLLLSIWIILTFVSLLFFLIFLIQNVISYGGLNVVY